MALINPDDIAGQEIASKATPKWQWSLLRPRFWKTWLLIAAMGLLSLLPYRVMRWLGHCIGKIFATSNLKVVRMRREVARINIDTALANQPASQRDAIFKQHCLQVGHSFFDVIIAWWWPDWRFKKMVKQPDFSIEPYYNKQPYLYLCAHFHNLEIMARGLNQFVPSYGVYLTSNNEVWEWFQYRMRVRKHKALIDRSNLRLMLRTLDLKQGLFYAPDQSLSSKSAVYVPFFSVEQASTSTGTYMLYRRYPNLVLLPCVLQPSSDPNYIYELKVLEPLTFAPDLTVEQVTTLTNRTIEKMVATDYSNYMWMHKRFKYQPDGSDIYASVPKVDHSRHFD